ncbi:MAG: DUF952 domain-containing protein [Pseudomonadota bacterium]
MAENMNVYKILSASDWAVAERDGVSRTALDDGDGYVHLSTRAQVGETLALHYKGAERVRLLEFALDILGEVRWESSRGGDLFPHLYGDLKIADAARVWTLDLDAGGVPKLPEDL